MSPEIPYCRNKFLALCKACWRQYVPASPPPGHLHNQSSSQDAKSVITTCEEERNDFQLCFQGEKTHHSLAQGGSQCFQKSDVNWSQIWTLVNYKANFPINSGWNLERLLRFRGWWEDRAAELPEIISIAMFWHKTSPCDDNNTFFKKGTGKVAGWK